MQKIVFLEFLRLRHSSAVLQDNTFLTVFKKKKISEEYTVFFLFIELDVLRPYDGYSTPLLG